MISLLFLTLALISCSAPHYLTAAILIHELGHIGAAYFAKWERPRPNMNLTGLRLSFVQVHSPISTLAVCMAGSLLGILTFFIPLLPEKLRLYSLGLALINLLPISVLDGGGALLCLLECIMLPDKAYGTAKWISVIFAILFCLFSVAVQLKIGINPTLLAVSVYITVSSLGKQ